VKKRSFLFIAAVALVALVSCSLFLQVQASNPTAVIEKADDYYLDYQLTLFNRKQAQVDESFTLIQNPFKTDSPADYTSVVLRLGLRSLSVFPSELLSVLLTSDVLNDGIFIHKSGSETAAKLTPFYHNDEEGLTTIFLYTKGMSNDQIKTYIHSLTFEITIKSLFRTYTLPIPFDKATVSYAEIES
jgi:hypothetical protein